MDRLLIGFALLLLVVFDGWSSSSFSSSSVCSKLMDCSFRRFTSSITCSTVEVKMLLRTGKLSVFIDSISLARIVGRDAAYSNMHYSRRVQHTFLFSSICSSGVSSRPNFFWDCTHTQKFRRCTFVCLHIQQCFGLGIQGRENTNELCKL